MTDNPTPTVADAAVPEPPEVPAVQAAPGSRLEQLHQAYGPAKAAADEAAAQLKAVVDGIKSELAQAAPEGVAAVDLAAAGEARALRLSWVESWRVDARRLKALDPETYVRYAKKSGTWVLKPVGGGDR